MGADGVDPDIIDRDPDGPAPPASLGDTDSNNTREAEPDAEEEASDEESTDEENDRHKVPESYS